MLDPKDYKINYPFKGLIFDTEVSPILGYAYGKYETNLIDIVRNQFLMSVSFKWLGSDKIETYALPDFKTWKRDRFDDRELTQVIWEAVNKADIVIAHNAKKFDIRKINTRFILNDMRPTKRYKVIDTLQVARKYFSFPGNSLNDLAQYFDIGKKLDKKHGDLWKSCLNGDEKSWKYLKQYNKHDVVLLEGIYKKMHQFIDPFPVVHSDNEICRHCGGKIIKRGFNYTRNSKVQQYQCITCGSYQSGERIPTNLD